MNCHYSAQGDYKCTKPTKEGFALSDAQKAAASAKVIAGFAKIQADAAAAAKAKAQADAIAKAKAADAKLKLMANLAAQQKAAAAAAAKAKADAAAKKDAILNAYLASIKRR